MCTKIENYQYINCIVTSETIPNNGYSLKKMNYSTSGNFFRVFAQLQASVSLLTFEKPYIALSYGVVVNHCMNLVAFAF